MRHSLILYFLDGFRIPSSCKNVQVCDSELVPHGLSVSQREVLFSKSYGAADDDAKLRRAAAGCGGPGARPGEENLRAREELQRKRQLQVCPE